MTSKVYSLMVSAGLLLFPASGHAQKPDSVVVSQSGGGTNTISVGSSVSQGLQLLACRMPPPGTSSAISTKGGNQLISNGPEPVEGAWEKAGQPSNFSCLPPTEIVGLPCPTFASQSSDTNVSTIGQVEPTRAEWMKAGKPAYYACSKR